MDTGYIQGVCGRRRSSSPIIPAGLIVFLNSASIPGGWSRYSAADGKMIIGAGGTYSATAIGGSWVTGTGTSSSDGAHTHTSATSHSAGFAAYKMPYATSDGAHAHTFSCTWQPATQSAVLIQADSDQSQFPANATIMATAAIASLSATFTSDYYPIGASAVATSSGGVSSPVVNSAGLHDHSMTLSFISDTSGTSAAAMGAHAGHTASISVDTNNIKRILFSFLSSASPFDLATGMFGLWSGASIPAGWSLCDGSGGTPDTRDYYIKVKDTGTGSGSGSANTLTVSGSLGSYSAVHDHYSLTNLTGGTASGNYVMSENWAHSHTIGSQTISWQPPYYALKVIKYTG